MQVAGVVVEYNPFHKGHAHHLSETKAITGCDYVVGVMSGHFVQRGEAAILDKWTRTHMALAQGVDVVIELPTVYATASADYFAKGSITLLDQLGIVDSLCFGSETPDMNGLKTMATFLNQEPDAYKATLQTYLGMGHNYPKARALALQQHTQNGALLATPNNILGVAYLRTLLTLERPITPICIQRKGAGYHDTNPVHAFPSATALRQSIHDSPDLSVLKAGVPTSTYDLFQNAMRKQTGPCFNHNLFKFLKYHLLHATPESLKTILDMTEGLEYRFLKAIDVATDYQGFMDLVTTRRYTATKLQRAILHILLDIKKKDFNIYNNNGYAQYVRVLGFRTKAAPLLKAMKTTCALPIIVNPKKSFSQLTSLQQKQLLTDIKATQIYSTLIHDTYGTLLPNDFSQPIIRLKV